MYYVFDVDYVRIQIHGMIDLVRLLIVDKVFDFLCADLAHLPISNCCHCDKYIVIFHAAHYSIMHLLCRGH